MNSGLRIRLLSCALCFAATAATTTATTASPVLASSSNAADGWNFNLPAPALRELCTSTIAHAEKAFSLIENDTGPVTVEHIYGAVDAMYIDLQDIQHIWYLKSVHPDTEIQAAAEQCIIAYAKFSTATDLSTKYYQRIAAIDTKTLPASERLMIENNLRSFRKVGIDRDEATRARVSELMSNISELGNAFDKNIRSDTRSIQVTAEQLDGLPKDYLDAHPVDEKGLIGLSTSYTDYFPIMKYAVNDDVRRQLFVAAKSIATPDNATVLKQLLQNRYELATLLGYKNFATREMDGLMIGSPTKANNFLATVGSAVKTPAEQDLAKMLRRWQKIDPGAETVQAWQSHYLLNLVKQEDYALDAREIREYFEFNKVQAGVFQLTQDLFDVEIVPWKTNTWHEDVTAWEIREQGKAIGRFYLDLHPRENKYKHAAHWTLRTGLKDKQLPLSGMAMNFPRGRMEHNQVTTMLHEFGHLLHNMFSGRQQWLSISGMSMERDFVEAPSQIFEEWGWDYDTLRQFATNSAGEPIPAQLVAKMNRARYVGEGARTAAQLFYASLALQYHARNPAEFELLPLLQELQAKYGAYPYVADTHFYNNFGHLNGYSSNYYIYQWSNAIALDLLSEFRKTGLRDPKTALAYRQKILEPGGSKPAAELVADFLGRPFSIKAYTKHLNSLN